MPLPLKRVNGAPVPAVGTNNRKRWVNGALVGGSTGPSTRNLNAAFSIPRMVVAATLQEIKQLTEAATIPGLSASASLSRSRALTAAPSIPALTTAMSAKAGQPVAGYTAWYRADSGFTASQWNDLSGNGYHLTQGTAAFQPTATSAGRGVTFDGSNDVMSGVAISNMISNSACTIFIVANMIACSTDSTTSYSNKAIWDSTATYQGMFVRSSGVAPMMNWDGNEDKVQPAYTFNNLAIFEFRHAAGSIFGRVTGGTEATAASGNTQVLTGTFMLGKSGANLYANIEYREILFYNTALGTTDSTTVRQYLANRHGL